MKEYIILNSLSTDIFADIYRLLASILQGKDAQDAGFKYLDLVKPWSKSKAGPASANELIELYKQEIKQAAKDGR